MLVQTLFSAAALLGSVLALPSGAPKCAINATVIAAAHGKQPDASLGYGVSVKMTGDSVFEVRVTNSAGRKAFQGILMYVNPADSPKTHLGKFDIDMSMFRFQTADICNAANIKGALEATFTHSSAAKKPIDSTVFKWSPLAADMAMTDSVVLSVAIADNDGDAAVKTKPRWVNFKVPFDFKKMMAWRGKNGMPMGMPMGEPMVRKVIKCKPKKMMCPACSMETPMPTPSKPYGGYGNNYPMPSETPMPTPSKPYGGYGNNYPMPSETPMPTPSTPYGGYGNDYPSKKGGYGGY
ncbi:hypothetical protein HK105_208785 [Polyrhizophydium stewartii]|uniref:Reelin domain-containing protein n=1 Tax=Polyrhizophydium stewartii TaxID=2732419 RepID=A0ABR4MWT4_9FUNG